MPRGEYTMKASEKTRGSLSKEELKDRVKERLQPAVWYTKHAVR